MQRLIDGMTQTYYATIGKVASGSFMASMAGVNKLAAGAGLMTFGNFAAGMGLLFATPAIWFLFFQSKMCYRPKLGGRYPHEMKVGYQSPD